jgi:hypothetical protein
MAYNAQSRLRQTRAEEIKGGFYKILAMPSNPLVDIFNDPESAIKHFDCYKYVLCLDCLTVIGHGL